MEVAAEGDNVGGAGHHSEDAAPTVVYAQSEIDRSKHAIGEHEEMHFHRG